MSYSVWDPKTQKLTSYPTQSAANAAGAYKVGTAPAKPAAAPQQQQQQQGGGGVDVNALLEQQRAIARQAYEEGLRRAASAFDQAKGLYDSGVQAVGKKKEEFGTQYAQGGEKILDRFEQERGNLQATAQNADTVSRNTLRALGLGGSAILKSQGAQRQNEAKAYGGLATQRNENDQANKSEYDSRLNWASGQEASLNAALRQAQEARTAAENSAGLIQAGDMNGINQQMGGFLNQIIGNQLALQNANAATGAKTVNPYAVNIGDLTGQLTAQLPTIGGQQGGVLPGNAATPTTIDQLLALTKKSGVYGGGLYA